uniref:Transmembrane protein n=1 Tax=Panagrellus redivivus TaxID=6233 RepID=A0A7E4UUF9_PANRE
MEFPWPIAVLAGGILAVVIIVLVVMLYKESNARNQVVSILPVKRNSNVKPNLAATTDVESGGKESPPSKSPEEHHREWLRRQSILPQSPRQVPTISTITLANTNPFETDSTPNSRPGSNELSPPELAAINRRPSATAMTEEELMGVGTLPRDIDAELDERDKRRKTLST